MMDDHISRQAAIDALEKVADLFPWRVPGKSDTYDRYNEAWNDAIGRAEMEIEKLPSVRPVDKDINVSCKDAISKQGAIDICNNVIDLWQGQLGEGALVAIKNAINNLPFVQPDIIHCKDCKHSEHWYRDKSRCFLWHEEGIDVFEDGFCNYAERKAQ